MRGLGSSYKLFFFLDAHTVLFNVTRRLRPSFGFAERFWLSHNSSISPYTSVHLSKYPFHTQPTKQLRRQVEVLMAEKDAERDEAGKAEAKWHKEVRTLEANLEAVTKRGAARISDLEKQVSGADVLAELRTHAEQAEDAMDQMERELREADKDDTRRSAMLLTRLEKAEAELAKRHSPPPLRTTTTAAAAAAAPQETNLQLQQLTLDNEELRKCLEATYDSAQKYQHALDEVAALKAELAQQRGAAEQPAEVSLMETRMSTHQCFEDVKDVSTSQFSEDLAAAKKQTEVLKVQLRERDETVSDKEAALDDLQHTAAKTAEKLEKVEKSEKSVKGKLRSAESKLKDAEKKAKESERNWKKKLAKTTAELETARENNDDNNTNNNEAELNATIVTLTTELAKAKDENEKLAENATHNNNNKDKEKEHEYERYARHYKKEAKLLEANNARLKADFEHEASLRVDAEHRIVREKQKRSELFRELKRRFGYRGESMCASEAPLSIAHVRCRELSTVPTRDAPPLFKAPPLYHEQDEEEEEEGVLEPPRKRARNHTAAPHPVSRRERERENPDTEEAVRHERVRERRVAGGASGRLRLQI